MGDAWRPDSNIEAWRRRAEVLREIRRFLDERGVLEVETPIMSGAANTDPCIDSFEVEEADHRWFLRTSPEFAMKRLLAAGSGAVYELGRVFRRGEAGRWHNPEFTMLEWYRPELDYLALSEEVCDLVEGLAAAAGRPAGRTRIAFRDLFAELAGGLDPLEASREDCNRLLRRRGWFDGNLSRRDALDLILSLGMDGRPAGELLVVYDYPASMAALARLDPDDSRLAQRFEVYLGGIELANGYQELTDADELARRFDVENAQRAAVRLKVMPVDRRLLAAHRAGLPDCAGVALGVDRLLAVLYGAGGLRDVVTLMSDLA